MLGSMKPGRFHLTPHVEFDPEWSDLTVLRYVAARVERDHPSLRLHVSHGTSKTNGVPRDEFCLSISGRYGSIAYGSAPFAEVNMMIHAMEGAIEVTDG